MNDLFTIWLFCEFFKKNERVLFSDSLVYIIFLKTVHTKRDMRNVISRILGFTW